MKLRIVLVALSVALLSACAQKIDDIDRTQPNRTKKADLEGTWYLMETVTNMPSTTWATFIGETSRTEKIVWVIEENHLLAYRSYPLVPGTDDVDGGVDTTAPDYHESPVASFPILSHFDVQRSYDSSTGEQQNVIGENTSDRPWYEREFMRVDWSRNELTNFDFIAGWFWDPIEATYAIDSERGEERGIYYERKGKELVYFDVPRRLLLQANVWDCIFSSPWYAWERADCAPAEIELVTSFAKTPARRDYEPLPYPDTLMNRFGFFLSERYVFDPQRGVLESARTKMANRHDIWEESYRKAADGSLMRGSDGRLVPIPVEERTPKPVVYYLSQTFPDDELLLQTTFEVGESWNQVFRETIAAVKGAAVTSVREKMFILCHNPVVDGDEDECGEVGFATRPGDLRYSTLHWVESDQLDGPLGYGPSATDPETGEIISGRAYVYGSGLSTYASYGVDVIRFTNGDLDPEELKNADHIREAVAQRANDVTNLDRVSPALRDVPIGRRGQPRARRETPQTARRDASPKARREAFKREPRTFDRSAAVDKLERARAAGLGRILADGEVEQVLAARNGGQLTDEARQMWEPTQWLTPTYAKAQRRRRMKAMARGVDFADMIDPNVAGIAKTYEGRTDYEQMWRELRAEVFRSTALHEIGHTLGLRHNFQGTYDSLNYHDEYWAARQENLFEPTNVFQMYALNALTAKQVDARMREFQYSSIMDYGLTFNTDLEDLGKYDRAAIVFAYTAGTTGSGWQDGYVEVFDKNKTELEGAGEILTSTDENGLRFDDPPSPIVEYLERWHYTTFIQSFPEIGDAFDRRWMRLNEYHDTRDAADGPVRVPYLFCSDEWVGALLSCQVFDHGADPYEMGKTLVDGYRAYYYFTNFKRDRFAWDPIDTLFRNFYYTFLPLSDYYQNWYLAPEGADPLMDEYYWWMVNMNFNLLWEAMATPPYGTYCTGNNGQLVNLTAEVNTRDGVSDYYLQTYCDQDRPFYEVAQGEGRRRFSTYDLESGYNFGQLPLEAGHYWTTLAAFWALTDPEAFVLGTDADVGTFSISFYDFFDDEIHALTNAVITDNYPGYSPIMEVNDDSGQTLKGTIHHMIPRPVYDADLGVSFNPETGEDLATSQGPSRATTGICEPCTTSSECNGYVGGFFGETFCQPIDDTDDLYCLQDCTNDADLCPDGQECNDIGNCVPADAGACDPAACGADNPHGACPAGTTCEGGDCMALWPTVETDATFSIVDDMLFYGMLYTTFSFSTRYNDQINVFKLGGAEEIVPGEGFEMVSFTDPISGDSYGAIMEACGESPPGGPVGLCEPCDDFDSSALCAGYTGSLGGAYCQPIADDDAQWQCLVDCTETDEFCPEGTVCNDASNCVPDTDQELTCLDFVGACSADNPLGSCPENSTCVDGECVGEASAQCRFGLDRTSGAGQMVLRGRELSQRYDETIDAYWSDDGSDPALEDQHYREFSRARYELSSHVEKINTIRAVFAIFGKVY